MSNTTIYAVDATLSSKSNPEVISFEVPSHAVFTSESPITNPELKQIQEGLAEGEVIVMMDATAKETQKAFRKNYRFFGTFGQARGWYVDALTSKIKELQALTGEAARLRSKN